MGRIMNIELETKQFMERWTGEIDNNEVFYRYNIDGNLVWFTQMQDSGNIYSVSVKLNDSPDKYFKVWVKCDDNKIFYPNDIEIEMKHSYIKPEDIGRVISDMHYIDNLCNMIMMIFKLYEHHSLWYEHHKDN